MFSRFSSGDLSSECDDVDPNDPTGTGRTPPLQQQPMPNPSGGPPNMPPPPAPTRVSGIKNLLTLYSEGNHRRTFSYTEC